MDRIEILGGLLKRVKNFSMQKLEDRIIFQKTIYFLQHITVNLNYDFIWYLYGPYSTELADDGFKLIGKINAIKEVCGDKSFEEKFSNFLNFLGNKRNDFMWLELLASIHFLANLLPKVTKEEIMKRVMEKQPYFNDKNFCNSAWNYLVNSNLLKERD